MQRLSITQFAAACGLSAAAVRRYADTAVLVPAHIDTRSGYRWYEPEQIPTGVLVRLLRELDVPLATVRAVLAAPTPDGQLQLLEEHWRTTTTKARRALATRDHLARVLGGWQDQVDAVPVTTGTIHTSGVLLRRRTASLWTYADVISDGQARLQQRAQFGGWQETGPLVSTYVEPAQHDDGADRADQRVIEVMLPVARRPVAGQRSGPGAPDTAQGAGIDESFDVGDDNDMDNDMDIDEDVDAVLPAGRLLYAEVDQPLAAYPAVLAPYGAVAQHAREHHLPITGAPMMVHLDGGAVRVGWYLQQTGHPDRDQL